MARDDGRGFDPRWGNGAPGASKSGDGPADLGAVHRDDQLLNALAAGQPFAAADAQEQALAGLLSQWVAGIDADPMPAGPDLDAVVAAVNQEIGARQVRQAGPRRGKLWLVRPLAGAAALAALALGGMTALSYNSTPGEPLWKVKEVVFSGQAASTVANIEANKELVQAEEALAAGDVARAQQHLSKANGRIAGIGDAAKKSAVAEKASQLQTAVSSAPATTSPPPTTGGTSVPGGGAVTGSSQPGGPKPSASTPRPTGGPSATTPPPATTPPQPTRPVPETTVKPTSVGGVPTSRPMPSLPQVTMQPRPTGLPGFTPPKLPAPPAIP